MHRSQDVIIHVEGNNIRNKDRISERSEILLKKYKELLVTAREMEKKVCVWYFGNCMFV